MSVKLGNILTTYDTWFGKEFNVSDDINDLDHSLPILVVGYSKAKEIHPDINILEFKYNDKFFWTYAKNEDRNGYVNGLANFKEYIRRKFLLSVAYKFIDPFELSLHQIKDTIKYIRKGNTVTFMPNNKMLYVLRGKVIFGVDLELFEFLGINKNKIINKIKSIKNNTLINSEIIIEYKDYSELFGDDIKYIPFLYSIDNDKQKHLSGIVHT